VIPPNRPTVVKSFNYAEYLSVSFLPITLATGVTSISPLCISTDNTLKRIGKIIASALDDQSRPEQWEVSSWATVFGRHLARHYGHRTEDNAGDGPRRNGMVEATISVIDRNLHLPLRIADLAEQAGMSESQFSVQFKEATGVSPHRFVVSRRIKRVCKLLSSGDDPLAEADSVIAAATAGTERARPPRAGCLRDNRCRRQYAPRKH
jgi:AraC-like DNA-binding protein